MRRRRQGGGGGGGAILPLPFPCWFWVTLMTSLHATVDELTETWGILVEIPLSQKLSPSIFCCSTAENNVIQLFQTECKYFLLGNCLEQKTLWCPHVSEWDCANLPHRLGCQNVPPSEYNTSMRDAESYAPCLLSSHLDQHWKQIQPV